MAQALSKGRAKRITPLLSGLPAAKKPCQMATKDQEELALTTSEPISLRSDITDHDVHKSISADISESTLEVLSPVLSPWKLSDILEIHGCAPNCATSVHELTAYDILRCHSYFDNKPHHEQNEWILQYFATHCPCNINGENDVKNNTYILQGKTVCIKVWLEVLSISSSRFYCLRHDFKEYGDTSNAVIKMQRKLSSKTMEAVAWMNSYFRLVGDKRPDKADAIYLPTCLTEKRIYDILVDKLYHGDNSKAICFSQFNKVFRNQFKNVSIPKV